MKGFGVVCVESIRKLLARVDYQFRRHFFPDLKPKGISRYILDPYLRVYDFIQTVLDKIRLKMLGLRDGYI
jgi:hypothetical protein